MKKNNSILTAHELTYIALAVAFLTVCSWLAIPAGDIPITLQTFAVFVISALLGGNASLMALFVYILMGLIGLPVFSGMTGGPGRILGPTGGYLIGFLFTILIVGAFSRRFNRQPLILAISMALGMVACYSFGTVWFAAVYMGSLNAVSLGTALLKCVVPYIIPDAVKITVATWMVRHLSPQLKLR